MCGGDQGEDAVAVDGEAASVEASKAKASAAGSTAPPAEDKDEEKVDKAGEEEGDKA